MKIKETDVHVEILGHYYSVDMEIEILAGGFSFSTDLVDWKVFKAVGDSWSPAFGENDKGAAIIARIAFDQLDKQRLFERHEHRVET